MDALAPIPARGRTFSSRCSIRLSDMDARGRLRLDAVARYLQDVASDDVDDTGWGSPDHLWVIRRIRIDVVVPFLEDRELELTTWCSGLAAVAAGRRWSLVGNRGGKIDADSVWIHLRRDGKPGSSRSELWRLHRSCRRSAAIVTRASRRSATHLAAKAPEEERDAAPDVHRVLMTLGWREHLRFDLA